MQSADEMISGGIDQRLLRNRDERKPTDKRLRHRCVLVSPGWDHIDGSDGNGNLKDVFLSPDSAGDSPEVEPIYRRRRAGTVAPVAIDTVDTFLTTLSLQRSLSLSNIDDVGCQPLTPTPTPSPITRGGSRENQQHLLTRRSSSIHGRAFKDSDFIYGDVIGHGFFGKAIKVHHRITGEVLVIKELVNCDEDAQKNFLKEAAILGGLKHPNLISLVGILYKEKILHIVTDYAPGGTLESLLHMSSVEPIPWWRKIELGVHIAAGMGYLHSQNVIHRDLNSPNCLIKQDGSAVVADFGLSKFTPNSWTSTNEAKSSGDCMSTVQHTDRTRSPRPKKKRYTMVGSPYWMAPEMLRGEEYDENVDLFSYGILLCEVIGQVRADPNCLERRSNFSLNEESFLHKFCTNCPPQFYQTAFQCCSMDAESRSSFLDVHAKLSNLYHQVLMSDSSSARLTRTSAVVTNLQNS